MVRLRVYALTVLYLGLAWLGNVVVTTPDQRHWFNAVVYVGAFVGIEALIRAVQRTTAERLISWCRSRPEAPEAPHGVPE